METTYQPLKTINTELWLQRADLVEEIGNIPDTFEYTRHIVALLKKVIQGWLVDLVGAKRVYDMNEGALQDEANGAFRDAVKPFLANAVWSLYLLQGNVEYSDTGPVQRMPDNAVEGISDRQRMELSRLYKDHAERYAQVVLRTLTSDSCAPVRGSGRPTIKAVGGRRRSRF